jgi:ATP/maltotriose-dependent transcriptional regulator MalT
MAARTIATLAIPDLKSLCVAFDLSGKNNHIAEYTFKDEDGEEKRELITFSNSLHFNGYEINVKPRSERDSKILEMFKDGTSQKVIGETLDIAQSTVSKVLSDSGYGKKYRK